MKLILFTYVIGKGSNGLNDAGRAATLIHEATHQLAKTGDDVNQKGNIIKANDGRSKPTGETGCACPVTLLHRWEVLLRTFIDTSNPNIHTTVAQVTADTTFTGVRDNANNMHDNAESYA